MSETGPTGVDYLPSWDRKRCMTLSIPGGNDPTLWAPAEMLAEVTKERDDYRRALALINAWRVGGMASIAPLDKLLRDAGFDFEDGRAMLGLIQWSRDEHAARDSAPVAPPAGGEGRG